VRHYLSGQRLPRERRWLAAADRFRRAIRLQPGPRRGVRLPGGRALDCAPYAHLAHALARAHLPRPAVEPALEKAEAAGVAPEPRLAQLRELLAAAGPLPLERALDITRQVAEALDYAHAKGVLHRDLEPENPMVERDGTVRVMDFGIARPLAGGTALTGTSAFVGTPLYAAPETIAGGHVDHRADLYALGVILFETLEGRAPFAGLAPLEQLRMHLDGRFPGRADLERPLPDPVWELVVRLTAREPGRRPPDAEAVLVELRRLRRALEEGRLA